MTNEIQVAKVIQRRRRAYCQRAACIVASLVVTEYARGVSPQTLTGTNYTQTFDNIGGGLPGGWQVALGATNISLGTTTGATFSASKVNWATTTGQFTNYASAADPTLNSASTTAQQAASTNRALGLQPTGSFGDPGGAFEFETASTVGFSNFTLSLDMMELNPQARSSTYSIQYGIGASPTSFTTLGTYADPGTFGLTHFSFDATSSPSFSTDIAGQSNVWFRIVSLTASTNTGSRDGIAVDNFTLNYTAPAVPAQYWDANGPSAGTGGTGIWDTVSPLWNPNSDGSGTATTFSSSTTLPTIFNGTPGTVTIAAGGVTVGDGIEFTIGGYTINGATLTMGGGTQAANTILTDDVVTPTIIGTTISAAPGLTKTGGGVLQIGDGATSGAVNGDIAINGGSLAFSRSDSVTYSNVLSGPGSISQIGSGTLKLSGNNTFTGGVTVASGTLQIGNAGALNSTTPNVLSLTGGTLDLNANSIGVTSLTGAGVVTDNSAGAGITTLTLNQPGTGQFDGTLQDGASKKIAISLLGTGGITLTGNNTFTGGLTDGGTVLLKVGSAGALNSTTPNAITMAGGTISLNGFSTAIGTLSGTAGTITDSSANVATTTLTVNQSSDAIYAGSLTNGFAKTLAVTKLGIGKLTLSGTTTFAGPLTINAGVIQVGSATAFKTAVTPVVFGSNALSTARFQLNGFNASIASLSTDSGVPGSPVVENASTTADSVLTVTNSSPTAFAGVIQDGGSKKFGLVVSGTSELSLNGNNTYTGGTTVNSGVLRAAGPSAFGNNAVTIKGGSLLANSGVTVSNGINVAGAVFTVLGAWDFTNPTAAVTSSSTATPPLVYDAPFTAAGGNGEIYLDGSNGSSLWVNASSANEVTGLAGTTLNTAYTGMVGQQPASVTTLSTFTGGSPNPSALAVQGGTSTGAANGKKIVFKVTNPAGLDIKSLLTSYATMATSTGFNSQAWEYSTDDTTWTSADTLTSLPSSYAVESLTPIANLGTAPTIYLRLTLTGATTASGNNRLDNIQITAQSLGGTVILGSDATTGTTTYSGPISLTTSATLNAASGGTVLFSGAISDSTNGPQGIATGDSGLVILSNANTFSGNTTVSSGTLNLSNNLAIQNSRLTNGGSGVVFDSSVATNAFTVGGLSSSNAIALTNSASAPITLSVGGGTVDVSSTFGGAITGTGGALTKVRGGTLTLTGSNNYTGATKVSGGTLTISGSLSGGGAVGVGGNTATVGGTPTLNGTGNITGPITVNGAGTGAAGHLEGGTSSAIGTLNTGPVTFASGSNLDVSLGAPGNSSQINVAGLLTLPTGGSGNQIVVNVFNLGGLALNTAYKIFSFSNISTFDVNGDQFTGGIMPAGDQLGSVTKVGSNELDLTIISSITNGSSFWTGLTDTNWATAHNWNLDTIPGVTSGSTNSDIATFNGAGNGNTAVVVDSGRNVKSITFDTASAGAYTIGSTGGNALTLSSGGTISVTSTVTNAQTINAPIVLAGGYTVTNNAPTATLTLGGAISSAASGTVTLGGNGTTILSGVNTYGGPTVIGSGTDTAKVTLTSAGKLASASVTVASGATANINGIFTATPAVTVAGTATLGANDTINAATGSLLVRTWGALNVSGNLTVAPVAVASHTSRTVLVTNGLTDTGTINLNNNDLVIHNGSASTVFSELKAGFNAGVGYWNGTSASGSINSNTATASDGKSAATDSRFLTTLGYRNGSAAFTFEAGSSSPMSTAATDVLVKYTYYGDADLNGTLNGSDYQQIDGGFGSQTTGSPLSGWSNGDFNYDGKINGSDFALIDNAMNQLAANPTLTNPLALIAAPASLIAAPADLIAAPAATSAVPEPTTLGLLGLGAMGLLGRRKRRHM